MKPCAVGLPEACRRLGISYRTGKRRVADGTFPVPELPRCGWHRYSEADIERYLAQASTADARPRMRTRAAAVVVLLLCALSASAQELPSRSLSGTSPLTLMPAPTKPEMGMSRWATWVNYAGPMANVATQEIAFAKFGIYDKAVGRRLLVGGLSFGSAALNQFLARWLPRDTANGQAVILAGLGALDAGRNIHVLITVQR